MLELHLRHLQRRHRLEACLRGRLVDHAGRDAGLQRLDAELLRLGRGEELHELRRLRRVLALGIDDVAADRAEVERRVAGRRHRHRADHQRLGALGALGGVEHPGAVEDHADPAGQHALAHHVGLRVQRVAGVRRQLRDQFACLEPRLVVEDDLGAVGVEDVAAVGVEQVDEEIGERVRGREAEAVALDLAAVHLDQLLGLLDHLVEGLRRLGDPRLRHRLLIVDEEPRVEGVGQPVDPLAPGHVVDGARVDAGRHLLGPVLGQVDQCAVGGELRQEAAPDRADVGRGAGGERGGDRLEVCAEARLHPVDLDVRMARLERLDHLDRGRFLLDAVALPEVERHLVLGPGGPGHAGRERHGGGERSCDGHWQTPPCLVRARFAAPVLLSPPLRARRSSGRWHRYRPKHRGPSRACRSAGGASACRPAALPLHARRPACATSIGTTTRPSSSQPTMSPGRTCAPPMPTGTLHLDRLDAARDDGAAAATGADRGLLQRDLAGVAAVAVGDDADPARLHDAERVLRSPEADLRRAADVGDDDVPGLDQIVQPPALVAHLAEPEAVRVDDVLGASRASTSACWPARSAASAPRPRTSSRARAGGSPG